MRLAGSGYGAGALDFQGVQGFGISSCCSEGSLGFLSYKGHVGFRVEGCSQARNRASLFLQSFQTDMHILDGQALFTSRLLPWQALLRRHTPESSTYATLPNQYHDCSSCCSGPVVQTEAFQCDSYGPSTQLLGF